MSEAARPITETTDNKPTHIAYATRRSGEKTFWNPCGAAWTHKDGKGIRIKLDAMPVNGVIELRINDPKLAANDTNKIDWTFSDYDEGQ